MKKITLVLLFGFACSAAYAEVWEGVKEDAAKAWEGTKENGSKVADDAKEAYKEGKNTTIEQLSEDAKKQGLKPVKPETDGAGIPK